MSRKLTLLRVSLVSLSLAAPRLAHATDFYGRLYLGPAYIHNDDVSGRDSSGFGVAAQLDLGARLARALALHATVIADDSRSMTFDGSSVTGEYVTTVVGLGVGATSTWKGVSLGVSSGAQLTSHPDALNPNDGPSGAGLGPFISGTLGYVVGVSDDLQLGAHGLARYRAGKDEVDPSGYQLGLGLSVALVDEHFQESAPERASPPPARPGTAGSIGAMSAQMGWWNAELELLTESHFYVALGGPWVGALLGPSEDRLIIPFGARIGYQMELWTKWKLRAAAHLVGLYGSAGTCVDCASDAHGTDSWQLFELGARYESGTGLVYGIDVPVFVINDVLGLDNDPVEVDAYFAPPLSLAFMQLYVGYSWPI